MATFEATLTLPTNLHIRNVAGNAITLDLSKVPVNVLEQIVTRGSTTILGNVWNGGGSAATETERLANLQKKMDAWYRGEYASVERSESGFTAMREQYIDERRAAAGLTRAQVEKAIKDTVAQVFGKDEAATFSKFLDAVATVKAKANGTDAPTERAAIESALAERTAKAAAERAAASKDLDLTDIGL